MTDDPLRRMNPDVQRTASMAIANAGVQQILGQLDSQLRIIAAQHERIVLLEHELEALRAERVEDDQ